MAKRIRSLILLLWVWCPHLFAGVPAATEPLRFTVWAFAVPPPLALAPGDTGAAPVPLQFHPSTRSPVYEWAGADVLRFVELETGRVVAEARVPAELKRVLLIFAPMRDAASRLRYQVLVMDDSERGLPKHSLCVLNCSGWALRGSAAGQSREFSPGLSAAIPAGGAVQVQLSAHVRGRWWQSHASQFELGPSQRALLVVLPPYYPGSPEVQVRRLVDELP